MAHKAGKGAGFERDLCRQLSLWWTQGEAPRDDIFWRTSNSGGRATNRGKKGATTYGSYGDIAAVDPIGLPLLELATLELKRGYNKATSHDLFDRPETAKEQTYEGWFSKAERDATAAGSATWILIHKRDRREPLAFVKDCGFPEIEELFTEGPGPIATIWSRNHNTINIFILSDLLRDLHPIDITGALVRYKKRNRA